LWVDDVGATTTYTNARSCQTVEEGDGLNIVWRPGYHKGYSSGPTHFGMSDFGNSGLRRRVHFARIYGVPQDFGLLGSQDYVFVDRDDNPVNGGGDGDKVGGYTYRIRVWKNKGSGGTKIKGQLLVLKAFLLTKGDFFGSRWESVLQHVGPRRRSYGLCLDPLEGRHANIP
jgi:hypothetical protein